MASATLKIGGMTCDHCRTTVEDALKGVPGTFGAAVFLDDGDGEAEVDFDDGKASIDLYIRAIESAGYTARLPE